MNALAITGMRAGMETALADAIERALTALGVGSIVALLLFGLVIAVEAIAGRLAKRSRSLKKHTRPCAQLTRFRTRI